MPPNLHLQVETWPIGRLTGYARNPRKNDEANVDRMVASIREFGFRAPIVAMSDGLIVDGHLRLAGAKKFGMTEVPVALADGLSEAQVKAFRLLANRSATWAEFDKDLLTIELLDLDGLNYDLDLTGFDPDELTFYTGTAEDGTGADLDDVPATPLHPVTVLGDVWILGRHRLYCSDCRDVFPTLSNIDAVVADPPYGIGFDYDQHDDTPEGYGPWVWDLIERAEKCCGPGAPIFVWQASPNIRSFADWFPRDWRLFCAAKNFVQMRKTAMQYAYDPVLVWWKPGAPPWSEGTASRDWHVADTASVIAKPDNIEKGHPCPRPVDQVSHIVQQWCRPDSTILDPFVGSGTTIIAAQTTGRICHGIELSPQYCDVTVKRFQALTGTDAIHEPTGKTFDEMALERPFGEPKKPSKSRLKRRAAK